METDNSRWIPQWQQSAWLAGELVLFLDEAFSTKLCGFHITYTKEKGLQYRKEENDGEQGM